MTVTGWQVVREKGKQPDNREQLVGSVTPACPAWVSPETKQIMQTLTVCHRSPGRVRRSASGDEGS